MSFLENINDPADLRQLNIVDLMDLAEEIREVIIRTVASNGGHLAPSLGVVELTLALHYVFQTPEDLLVWDVGHQAYAHKLITGRRDRFSTLRQLDGLSGFPKRQESPYDAFDVGHSSTSISAALGMGLAREQQGKKGRVLAVIGDGSMTAGMSFEALNHAGSLDRDLIVVLNDNEMSISNNVGALSSYLNRLMTGEKVNRFRHDVKSVLTHIPGVGNPIFKMVKRAEGTFKGFVVPLGTLFEDLGFQYVGPLPGHSLEDLVDTFNNVKKLEGPILVHVITKKGKGYAPAEKNPADFHGVGPFDIDTGRVLKKKNAPMSYTAVFGQVLVKLARDDERLMGITAAMPAGTGMEVLARDFPGRVIDVGIAEQHGVTLAAGMATQGLRPFVAVYSTFMQRAYDQIIHDVALQQLPVTLCLDRGGLVGEDGPTHHGMFDLSYLRLIPGLTIMAPKDENELQHLMKTALYLNGPAAIRYPRGSGLGVEMDQVLSCVPVGSWEVLREGVDGAVLAVGSCVEPARQAIEALMAERNNLKLALINCRFVKPMDEDLLCSCLREQPFILTVEENSVVGGFGSAVAQFQAITGGIGGARVVNHGLPDRFIEHGSLTQLRHKYGLDAEGITALLKTLLQNS
ncbi:MAG: 1-deoxy-D-xylulose-5-phosphate synthase [Deltaproteobacteria bacterium]|nr:1-deoxy-D-xylulose-5-phosphate synthase [Candidatus Anaeroferrophillus wilburensis]MBN2888180.1 1-deoxy-D-xylulose-5-phosphate synthase [Deltaproteobacteria bacterium]